MPSWKAVLAITVGLAISTLPAVQAQQKRSGGSTLSTEDRAQIQELVAHYARALGTCAAEEYAGLFAAPDGYFASGPRGNVAGREKLVALVRSERHCNDNSERRATNAPTVVAEPSPGGATGKTISGPNGGHYEDVYVKTPQGWRFKARAYISTQEEAAHLTAQDFIDIRQLAGNDTGQFRDVHADAPEGKRFRSSGVVIAPSPEGATGKAYLSKDSGSYDDVYVKTSRGWRFKSRMYVSAADSTGSR
jgi:hypothetical protein